MLGSEEPPNTPRVWIKAFYGFNPEEASYVGFTKLGDRDSFIEEAKTGDLVLIYGSTSSETAPDDRRQALGFLEVELLKIKDSDRASEKAKKEKIVRGWKDRWTYAVPVRRAWTITRPIEVKNIAPDTYVQKSARRIASRGALLTETEAIRALQLPVVQSNVFGETPVVQSNEREQKIAAFFEPSRGIKPSFGMRSSNYSDGECFLYLMIAKGDVAALLGRSLGEISNKILVKIGYSNDPQRRCKELNDGIPPAGVFKWHLEITSKAFADSDSALEAEDYLKSVLKEDAESLGGEFFLGSKVAIENAFYHTPGVALVIKGAYRK